MKPQLEPSTQEVLAGLVERVTYHNPENGFCVLRAKARWHRDVVTVVGHAATIAVRYQNHRTWSEYIFRNLICQRDKGRGNAMTDDQLIA
jgi:hypothetical protein